MTAPLTNLRCHVAYPVGESSAVGEVRRAATRLARSLAFDDVAVGRVALVATELGNNLVHHARGGRLLVGTVEDDDGSLMVELLSIDRGPGMANVQASMADGHSTGGTSGTGLGAVRRLSQHFDLYSTVPQGTVVMARLALRAAPRSVPAPVVLPGFVVGGVRLAAPGEVVSGDDWAVRRQGHCAALMVVDGLGHGPLAHEAARAAVAAFASASPGSPSETLECVHQALRGTRGAAVALAVLDGTLGSITFAGAGNIAGRVISGISDRSLMSQHGTAGLHVRRLQDQHHEWPPHALVVMHSDGIASRWTLDDARGLLMHHPSLLAGWLMREQLRGSDDATVVVIKRREPG